MADAFLGDFYWMSEGNLDMDHPVKTPLFAFVVCFDPKIFNPYKPLAATYPGCAVFFIQGVQYKASHSEFVVGPTHL